jgi:hypothetical protein
MGSSQNLATHALCPAEKGRGDLERDRPISPAWMAPRSRTAPVLGVNSNLHRRGLPSRPGRLRRQQPGRSIRPGSPAAVGKRGTRDPAEGKPLLPLAGASRGVRPILPPLQAEPRFPGVAVSHDGRWPLPVPLVLSFSHFLRGDRLSDSIAQVVALDKTRMRAIDSSHPALRADLPRILRLRSLRLCSGQDRRGGGLSPIRGGGYPPPRCAGGVRGGDSHD